MDIRPAAPTPTPAAPAASRPGGIERSVFGDDGFTFGDVLDIVNPLHHVPVVGTLYRDLTSDEIAHGPRILGGGIVGGLLGSGLGILGSVADVVVKELSGKDVGEHVMSWFRPEDAPDAAPTAPAENGLPPHLEIARGETSPGAVRSAAEAALARADAAPRRAELERALVAYQAQSHVDPWVRLADRTR